MKISIRGIQEAQNANVRLIASLRPGGALSRAVKLGLSLAHSRAVIKTHVITGGLRASHRMMMQNPFRGRVYIDPQARRSDGKKPIDYGPIEHRRGGSHAFYQRVESEDGLMIARAMGEEYVRGLTP